MIRFLAFWVACYAAIAQTTAPAPPANESSAAQKYFTDTVLVDQNGTERRFYSDLIKDRVVIINAMFATCKDSCPRMAETFAHLQDWLGDRIGKEAYMLSISVDPETDTPARLQEYAQRFKAKPGWYFLTGRKANVETVLKRLGFYVDQKQDHLTTFLIGNDRTGLWKKAIGVAPAEQTIATFNSVLQDAP
jgi:protein SCO1/2